MEGLAEGPNGQVQRREGTGRWDKRQRGRLEVPSRYPDTLKISRVSETALYLSTCTLAWSSDKEGCHTLQMSCPSPGLDAPQDDTQEGESG